MKIGSWLVVLMALAGYVSAEGCGNVGSEGLMLTHDWVVQESNLTSTTCLAITDNNAVIDCNGYSVYYDRLACHDPTYFISAGSYNNTILRNCNVSMFSFDLLTVGSQNMVVENNIFDNNENYIYDGEAPGYRSSAQVILQSTNNATVRNNIFASSRLAGLDIISSSNFTIESNNFADGTMVRLDYPDLNRWDVGLLTMQYSDHGLIRDNIFNITNRMALDGDYCAEEFEPETWQEILIGAKNISYLLLNGNTYIGLSNNEVELFSAHDIRFIDENFVGFQGIFNVWYAENYNITFLNSLKPPKKKDFFTKRPLATCQATTLTQ